MEIHKIDIFLPTHKCPRRIFTNKGEKPVQQASFAKQGEKLVQGTSFDKNVIRTPLRFTG